MFLIFFQGEEEGHDHVGRVLEFFKTNTNEDYFRVQWFFRAQDTVRILSILFYRH